ncbi:phytochelatin synthase family protein [Mesorhizobium tianshanense]|uniref:phytochelatin synthase family protein n=1 Tax=Mesorhizobium tianshanense TaxID=39844 RepID=UPI0011A8D26C|nr:phytochelatin synthase family protein [Mesorhizobium tianshanense]
MAQANGRRDRADPQFRVWIVEQGRREIEAVWFRCSAGEEKGGHISPLAAYDGKADRFLILDVARRDRLTMQLSLLLNPFPMLNEPPANDPPNVDCHVAAQKQGHRRFRSLTLQVDINPSGFHLWCMMSPKACPRP